MAHGQGGTDDVHGRETFRKWLRWYTSAFVDREWAVHYILSEDDKAVARCSGRSVYTGGLLDIPSRDQRAFETNILILCVEGGFVQELWSEMSDLQVVMQLGAFPVPERYRIRLEGRAFRLRCTLGSSPPSFPRKRECTCGTRCRPVHGGVAVHPDLV